MDKYSRTLELHMKERHRSSEAGLNRERAPFQSVSTWVTRLTPLSSPTHPGRLSKRRRLMDDEAKEVVDLKDFEESLQYAETVLASECYYWRGYDDGVAEPRLAGKRG